MRKIGISEVAKLANVSIGTVDRALHGRARISETTRKRVLEVARKLGYRPNLAARALSMGRGNIRIGVCIPREIHFFYDQIRHGIASEARRYEHLGLDFVYRPVDHLGVGEVEKVKELLASDIKALIVTPGDPKRLSPLVNEGEHAGIRVICVATDAPDSDRSTVVCVDPELNGRLAGELLGKLLPPKSLVAIVTGMLWTEDHRKKVQGFSDVLPQTSPGSKVVRVLEGHEDEDETFVKCIDLLRKLRRLAGLYVSTANCLPVCRALGALGLAGQMKLITTDLFREMVPYFEKGTISASIHQRPYVQGQTAVRLAVDHLVGGRPFPPSRYLNPAIVLRSNLPLFREIREAELSDTLTAKTVTIDE
jgi:LacI family transcriptional regulator